MQRGYIDLGIDKTVMLGIAGSGKTCSLAALLGKPPPAVRCSTPLMERPVQVMVIFVDDEMQWQKMTSDDVRQRIAQIIRSRATAQTVVAKSSLSSDAHPQSSKNNPSSDGQQPPNTTDRQPHLPAKEYANTAASSISGATVPSNVSERQETPIARSTSEVTIDSLLELSDLEEEFVTLINNSKPSAEPILKQNWLYMIDSGGQHEFHEVLPIFLNGASNFIFVFRVHESMDEQPLITFYDHSGQLLCEPCPSYLTNEEIFRQCMCTMYSFISKSKDNIPPQILLLGTHRDMVKEEDLPKVLESLNERLKKILLPHFKNQILHKTLDDMIFTINAKQPERRERECLKAVQAILTSKLGRRRVNVPLRWYVLEQKLRQIAMAMKVTVLSVNR